jgi:hypothetical protein
MAMRVVLVPLIHDEALLLVLGLVLTKAREVLHAIAAIVMSAIAIRAKNS